MGVEIIGFDTLGSTKVGIVGGAFVGSDGPGRTRLGTLSAGDVAAALGVVCSCSSSSTSSVFAAPGSEGEIIT